MLEGWRTGTLGDVADILTGHPFKSAQYTDNPNGMRLLRGDNIVQGSLRWDDAKRWPLDDCAHLDRFSLRENDLVVAMDRTWVKAGLKVSRVRRNDLPCLLVQRVARIRAFDATDQEYLIQSICTHKFEQYVKGGQTETAVPHISPTDLREFPLKLPPLPEQRRIAEILRTWDEAIEKLEALRAAKVAYTSSIFLKFFEKEYGRAKGLVRAKALFEPISERGRPDLPLLAVMQQEGIVRRDELDRRVTMPDGDTSNYKVVRPGDFVISLRSFEGGIEHSNITGLVSPAYTVLRPLTELDGDYYRHFFKSRSFIGRLDNLIFGIRDGKQIAFRDFGDMLLPNPPLESQKKQTAVMRMLEMETLVHWNSANALKRQKRGLMQKLLTGEWRVKVEENVDG